MVNAQADARILIGVSQQSRAATTESGASGRPTLNAAPEKLQSRRSVPAAITFIIAASTPARYNLFSLKTIL
jgi:hypothetical protein